MDEKTYTPPPVAGYRQLSQTEVDLMNRIKAHGVQLQALVEEVRLYERNQYGALTSALTAAQPGAEADEIVKELDRIDDAQPARWINIARTDFQTGLMALTRAVAQPSTF